MPSLFFSGEEEKMTELEKMQRAKTYLEALSRAMNPLDGSPLPGDTVLHNERLSRCFTYVSEVLRRVIDNGGEIGKNYVSALPFVMTPEQQARVFLSETPINITEFVRRLNAVLDPDVSKKVMVKNVTGWLVENGYLTEIVDSSGQKSKQAAQKGIALGISTESRHGAANGVMYFTTLYNFNAQRFILGSLAEIMENASGTPLPKHV